MVEYDVKEILGKDGIEHIELGNGESIKVTKLADLIKENSKYRSWAKRVIDTSNSGCFHIATVIYQSKGSGCRRHYHPDCDECWVVLKGEFEFEIGKDREKVLARAGDIIFARKGVEHKITVVSDDSAIRLSIGTDLMANIQC